MPDREFYAKALKTVYCWEKTIRPAYALPILPTYNLDPTQNPFVPSKAQIDAATKYFRAVWRWWRDQKRDELLALCPASVRKKLKGRFAYPESQEAFDSWVDSHIYGTGNVWGFLKRIERAPDEETWWRTVAVGPLGGIFLNEIATTQYQERRDEFPAPKVQLEAEREFYLAEQGLKSGYLTGRALARAGYSDLNETFGISETIGWGRTACSLRQYNGLLCATAVEELKEWVATRAGTYPSPYLYEDMLSYTAERLDFHLRSFLIPYIREQVQRAREGLGEPESIFVTLPDGQRYLRDNYTYDAFQDAKRYAWAIRWLRSWLGWGTPYGYVFASNNILQTTDMVPAKIRRLIEWIDTPYRTRPIGDTTVVENAGFRHWGEFTTVLKKAGFDTDEEILEFIDYYLAPRVTTPTSLPTRELDLPSLSAVTAGGLALAALYWLSRD